MLTAQNVHLQLGGTPVLKGISLTAEAGTITVVMGANGSGKTSLIRLLTGEIPANQGSIHFNHDLIENWSPARRACKMAVLPQASTLNFPFTVKEVVMLGRTPHSTGLKKDAQIVSEVLELVDAIDLESRLYTHLSGGEKQRVQLARVLAQIWNPEDELDQAILLDEPSASLDLEHQQLMLKVVKDLALRNVTVLLVLHDINLATFCADQIIMLRGGQVAKAGKPIDVVQPDIIKQIFNVDVDVIKSQPRGLPVVIPR